jgi:S-(hydroxymethyl)glutathione dehydrogenase / alcohol dehydrogenase
MKRTISGQKRVQGVSIGSSNSKREPYLQGRMNLDDPVSKRISLSEVNDGRLADPRRHPSF